MTKSKKHLYQSRHHFNEFPFESVWLGSWWPVQQLKIRNGYLSVSSIDGQHVHQACAPTINLRVRSRTANPSDCTCYLRPGLDVCVVSPSSNENSNKVWVDARITSVKRSPHEPKCSCQFYVNLYVSDLPLGSGRGVLGEETFMIGIDKISILQRLGTPQGEEKFHRWTFSEDCPSLPRTKLLMGKFLPDISWLLVASSVKNVSFDVISFQNKIVYQIRGSNREKIRALNFKIENDVMVPVMIDHVPYESSDEEPESEEQETFPDTALRRSKRRNVEPDRYLACDVSKLNLDPYRYGFLKNKKSKYVEEEEDEEDEMSLPLSVLFGMKRRGRKGDRTKRKRRSMDSTSNKDEDGSWDEKEELINIEKKPIRKPGSGRKKGLVENHLAIVPVPMQNDPMALVHNSHNWDRARPSGGGSGSGGFGGGGGGGSGVGGGSSSSLGYYLTDKEPPLSSKSFREREDMELDTRFVRMANYLDKKAERKKYYRPPPPRRERLNEERIYGQRTLSAGLYKDLIDSYMRNMDSSKIKDDPPLVDQWKEMKARRHMSHRNEPEVAPAEESDEESEMDMLWKEMELCMTSSYLFEDNEGSKGGASSEFMTKDVCPHDFRLNEEIGIICTLCGVICTEIKDVLPPFMPTATGTNESKMHGDGTVNDQGEEEGLDITYNNAPSDPNLAADQQSVWNLIPELGKKLHLHQKRAFEFLWKNVAGSLIPRDMESKRTGGCVVSHAPGAGKTFLIIAFLVSYLKLFPGKRPLVLAPKTTLYTWHKEFVKWEIPIPVYLIHGRRSYRVFKQNTMEFEGLPKPGQDVMHVLDCLEKIQKWHAQPSVLVMGYTSFLTLMREDSKFAHRKHMAKVLRESPGILILDEGHNPRSTKSRLRKGLMKVETDLRILLSGTLFQNNFCEYFNTLCLARPKFVNEVLRELDPKYKRKKKKRKARNLLEARARKFFIDNIGKKIDSSNADERMQGLNMLRNITGGFIDVYEGGNADTLPGMQSYTMLMNPSDIQLQVLLKLHRVMTQYKGYPLELELLITLGSIHPWLVKTACCASKFFSTAELDALDEHKYDIKKGSKVKFVLSLVYRVFRKEKTLIFCHNIAPIHLFLELFQRIFGWKKGKEVLVLSGDMELFERGRIMDTFEEPGGPSRVMIASITACAEGISLTAASRVILLDSEWNPSKTKQAIARAFRPGQQKMVYVYQLLASNTLEEDKYRRTTWKEWVSCMIFSEAFVEDPSCWQAQKIEDEILREMVAEDRSKSIHMIMKNEKTSTN